MKSLRCHQKLKTSRFQQNCHTSNSPLKFVSFIFVFENCTPTIKIINALLAIACLKKPGVKCILVAQGS